MKIVKFKYYDEFHCIGAECPDSCCEQWSIIITKREYLNYKKYKCSPRLKNVISNAFIRTRNEEFDSNAAYAQIKLNENRDCPFHDFDGLCMIQKELGEKALSYTCATFPRLHARIGNDALLCACNITCCHVVEMLMNHPESLEITEEEYNYNDRYINSGFTSAGNIRSDWKGYQFFWIIKNAEIDILQNRNFTISERMLILGFFCKKVEDYLENNEGQKIESLYNMILDNDFCKKVADSLKAPQSDTNSASKSINVFTQMNYYVQNSTKIEYTKKHFNQVQESLGIVNTINDDNGIITSYNNEKYFNHIGVFRSIESNRPYILENILLNQAFISSPSNGAFKNFFALAVFYNTLKICIPTFLKENWNDKDLALAFTYAAKMILNTHLADDGAIKSFMRTGSFDLPHAAFLIN